jgi:WD40 repeat protein
MQSEASFGAGKMSAIFISHSSRDLAAAGELKARLSTQGHRSVFLDFDPEDGIPAGRDWERELYSRLRGCQAVIVLCSEYSMASRWCFAEIAFARSLGKALLPLKIGECTIPVAFKDVQSVDLRADPEAGYRRLWAGLRQAGLDPAAMFDWDGSRPPYPGLMVFQEQDAAIYFGRGAENQATIEKLNRMQRLGDGQLAMILGASGSGKSSLLRAGVLPRLKRDKDRWLVPGVFRPLGQPFERLAVMLSAAFKSTGGERPWQEIHDQLAQPVAKDAAVNLVELATELRAASGQAEATLLLCVDQFEELLAAGESDIADRFLALLRSLTEVRSSGIVIIGTLRSDFLGNFQNHAALRGVSCEPIDLPQLSVEAFAEVIEGPAKVAGLELEPGLAGAIVADAAIDDALPLLAFALRELWEVRGADGRLTIDKYRAGLGGLQGSVAKAADGLYPKAFATPKEERDVRASFLSMVRVDAGGAYVRKPARWGDLSRSAHGLLERFVQGRLLVARGEGTDRILEVAHEALIRRWDKLCGWVEEDREFLRTRERSETAVARWIESGRDASLLLPRGRPLAEAQEMLTARRPDLAPDVVAFVEASMAAKRAQDEEERKVQQERLDAAREREAAARRLAMRTRIAALGIGVLAVLAAGFGWYAKIQAGTAEERADQLQKAASRLLGSTAQQLVGLGITDETAPAIAALAATAYRTYPSADAWNAMQRLPILGSVLTIDDQNAGVWTLAFSPNGRLLVVGNRDGVVQLLDVGSGKVVAQIKDDGGVSSAAFSPDGRLVATGGAKIARLIDTANGKVVQSIAHDGVVKAVAFSPDGRLLATGSEDKIARLIDTANGKIVQAIAHGGTVTAVAFSPDGRLLATASEDTFARLIDTATSKVVQSIAHGGVVTAVTFSPNGRLLATASEDKLARLIDTENGKVVRRVAHGGTVTAVAFSPDGQRLSTGSKSGSEDKVARIIYTAGKDQFDHVTENGVLTIAFSPDGRLLATGDSDGLARLIRVTTGEEVARIKHEGPVTALAFSPDGHLLATGNDSWPPKFSVAIKLVAIRASRSIPGITVDSGIRNLMFSPDGRMIMTGNRLIDVETLAIRRFEHDDDVLAVRLGLDKKLLAISKWGDSSKLIELPAVREIARIGADYGSIVAFDISPDGAMAATAHDDFTVRLFNIANGHDVRRLNGGEKIADVLFSPDGRLLAIIADSGVVRLIEATTGQETARFNTRTREIVFSPDGNRIVADNDQLIDSATGHTIAELPHDDWILSIAFSPDGRRLALGGRDKTARIFEATTGKQMGPAITHSDFVSALAFSADSRLIAAGGGNDVRVLDVATGNELMRITEEDPVDSVAFNPNGQSLAISSGSHINFWSTTGLDEMLRQLCSERGRNLATGEWQNYIGAATPWSATCDCWETPSDVIAAGLWPPKEHPPTCSAQRSAP